MAEKSYGFQLDGLNYRVSERQMATIQRLRDAIRAVATGTTLQLGLLEVNGEGTVRVGYLVSEDLTGWDTLIENWGHFQKYIQQETALKQGNAPAQNRSAETQ